GVKALAVDDALAAVAANPKSAQPHVALAVALLRAHKVADAGREIDEALRIAQGDKDAHFVAAKLAGMSKDAVGQEKHLHAIKTTGGDGFTVEMALAEMAKDRHD